MISRVGGANSVSQVWSFSPPEEMLYDRPLSLLPRQLEEDAPNRPMSAMPFDFRSQDGVSGSTREVQDVDMRDAGPSTAPLQGGSQTFFHDD